MYQFPQQMPEVQQCNIIKSKKRNMQNKKQKEPEYHIMMSCHIDALLSEKLGCLKKKFSPLVTLSLPATLWLPVAPVHINNNGGTISVMLNV